MFDVRTACGAALVAFGAARAAKPAPRELWYSVHAIRDMTGDGHADTLTLEAFGRKPESLKVVFRIRRGNRELFRAEWSSHDRYQDLIDDAGKLSISRDSLTRLARADMDEFFASTSFATAEKLPFTQAWHVQQDDDDPRDYIAHEFQYESEMAARKHRGEQAQPGTPEAWAAFDARLARATFDTSRVKAIGAEMRRLGLPTFTFSYGYESTETITWSPIAGRFFEVFYSD